MQLPALLHLQCKTGQCKTVPWHPLAKTTMRTINALLSNSPESITQKAGPVHDCETSLEMERAQAHPDSSKKHRICKHYPKSPSLEAPVPKPLVGLWQSADTHAWPRESVATVTRDCEIIYTPATGLLGFDSPPSGCPSLDAKSLGWCAVAGKNPTKGPTHTCCPSECTSWHLHNASHCG